MNIRDALFFKSTNIIIADIVSKKAEMSQEKLQEIIENRSMQLWQDKNLLTTLVHYYIQCDQPAVVRMLIDQYMPKKLYNKRFMAKLLFQNVLYGHQNEASEILMDCPALLIEKMTFTDCALRNFTTEFTVFQYAVWACDSYMVAMMLYYFQRLSNGLTIAAKQISALKKHGLSYVYQDPMNEKEFNKKVTGEVNFNNSQLIDVLRDYAEKILPLADHKDRIKYWCNVVGKEERKLPAHIMQYLCCKKKSPKPDESPNIVDFKRTAEFWNFVTSQPGYYNVYPLAETKLGDEFALYDGGFGAAGTYAAYEGGPLHQRYAGELVSKIEAYCIARINDIINITDYLVNPTASHLSPHLEYQVTYAAVSKSYQEHCSVDIDRRNDSVR